MKRKREGKMKIVREREAKKEINEIERERERKMRERDVERRGHGMSEIVCTTNFTFSVNLTIFICN